MPFEHIPLNDGSLIPAIGYGSSGISIEETPSQIDQAIDLGFEHIDTAQCKPHSIDPHPHQLPPYFLTHLPFLSLPLPADRDCPQRTATRKRLVRGSKRPVSPARRSG